jgi:uncharacterized protein
MNNNFIGPKTGRIEIADALRGFALAAIVILHNVEHYDFYYFPKELPQWLKITDKRLWDSVFFLFSGKAYALFALLFGFSFFIQFNNQAKKGIDFRGRFLWRMTLLLALGMINSIFYSGDILAFYAILGLILIVVCKWSDKAVLVTAVIFLLQPWELTKIVYILFNPDYIPPANVSGYYFGLADKYLPGSSFWDLAKGNIWNGRMADITWSWEQGRLFQTMAIFMLGMLIGRRNLFVSVENKVKFWLRVFLFSSVFFTVFFIFKQNLTILVTKKAFFGSFKLIISSWSNFGLAMMLVSGFVLLYQSKIFHNALRTFAPFGKMSLTNYMVQSMLGSFIYYGYGLMMYKHTGASYSMLIALTVIVIQIILSRWWLNNHVQGPMERLWHKATWMKPGKKNGEEYAVIAETQKIR